MLKSTSSMLLLLTKGMKNCRTWPSVWHVLLTTVFFCSLGFLPLHAYAKHWKKSWHWPSARQVLLLCWQPFLFLSWVSTRKKGAEIDPQPDASWRLFLFPYPLILANLPPPRGWQNLMFPFFPLYFPLLSFFNNSLWAFSLIPN